MESLGSIPRVSKKKHWFTSTLETSKILNLKYCSLTTYLQRQTNYATNKVIPRTTREYDPGMLLPHLVQKISS
jgi:hypothetical protein